MSEHVTQSVESDGAPWPAEDTLTLCEAALMGDADAITDWLWTRRDQRPASERRSQC